MRSPRVLRRTRLFLILAALSVLIYPPTSTCDSKSVIKQQEKPVVVVLQETKPESLEDYAVRIANQYSLDPYLVKSVISMESNWNPKAIGDHGRSIGLMQIQPRWHYKRMQKLGVTDLTDPYANILVGVDYLAELVLKQKDTALALMVYNMGPRKASELYLKGQISPYAKEIMSNARQLKSGGI